jgi:hypothetical protein
MRLWSIAPHYLDAKGLVALWRETLLAQAVLHGRTKGYKNHPQLTRFRDHHDLLEKYLRLICDEADARGYNFDRTRIRPVKTKTSAFLPVSRGQVLYEMQHLQKKLKTRDPVKFRENSRLKSPPALFTVFRMTRGKNVEPWEIV